MKDIGKMTKSKVKGFFFRTRGQSRLIIIDILSETSDDKVLLSEF